jgi:hypothetical protein
MNSDRRPDDLPEDELGQVRDEDGLLVDEYTAEAFDDPDAVDALDVADGHAPESLLDDVADIGGGIEEIALADVAVHDDDAEMGLGAEPHTPEELEDAAIGHALRGRRGVTRDDEVHGERLLDRPEA